MSENSSNFIYDIIDEDLEQNPDLKIHTRFPPEPNGYLHIGSAKAIMINYDTAKKYNGKFNLRYDDTNPAKEDNEYVESIHEDLVWLIGEEPSGGIFYGSDYFDKCYEYAVKLIKAGKAYVCDLSAEQMKEYRGTLTTPGNSHHRQGDKWCIYPLYDFAHPIQDTTESITHSLCSLEFENHRPLYDWVVENIGFDPRPKQREFARLNVTNTVMSKRYLRYLVENNMVDGWDDPRLPTLCALRRRGYTPTSIMKFVRDAGISKSDNLVSINQLEACIRDELNDNARRRICVANPIKVIITNYPEDREEIFELPNHPQHPEMGVRQVRFTRELYIDADDFALVPPPKFFRMKPGGEVRLMGSYIVKCENVLQNDDGSIREIHCKADLETRNNTPADGRKIKGTIHWLSAKYAEDITLKLYDKLFTIENVGDIPEDKTYNDYLNPDSLITIEHAKAEIAVSDAKPSEKFQFVRMGYFCKDTKYENTFNRVVSLKESFSSR